MKITGYRIRRALKTLGMQRDTLINLFASSLTRFENQKLDQSPQEIMEKIIALDDRVAKLQAAQNYYNSQVLVDVLGKQYTLSEAVKRLGTAGQIVTLWKSSPRQENYHVGFSIKLSEETRVIGTVSPQQATDYAIKAERFASALRGAVAEGNAVAVDLDLDPSLLPEE